MTFPPVPRPDRTQPDQPRPGDRPLPGRHESYWLDSSPTTAFPPLTDDIEADVVVVGGGIAGLSTAWECPCHGSRFATDGSVLQGPAVRPLERRELPEKPEKPGE